MSTSFEDGLSRAGLLVQTQVSHGGLPANHGAPAGARHRPLPPGDTRMTLYCFGSFSYVRTEQPNKRIH